MKLGTRSRLEVKVIARADALFVAEVYMYSSTAWRRSFYVESMQKEGARQNHYIVFRTVWNQGGTVAASLTLNQAVEVQ